jgi:hypothetical protein
MGIKQYLSKDNTRRSRPMIDLENHHDTSFIDNKG